MYYIKKSPFLTIAIYHFTNSLLHTEKIPKLMKESKNQTLREISEDKDITDRTIKLALDILIAEETKKHNGRKMVDTCFMYCVARKVERV